MESNSKLSATYVFQVLEAVGSEDETAVEVVEEEVAVEDLEVLGAEGVAEEVHVVDPEAVDVAVEEVGVEVGFLKAVPTWFRNLNCILFEHFLTLKESRVLHENTTKSS